jgi:hypothetical protein
MPSLAGTTSSRDPYPSTDMVRLAGDGAMFKIARFEKQFRYGWAAKSSESQKFFLTYADARNLRRCYWNRSTEAQP